MQQNTQFILFFFLIFLQITLITTQSFDPKRVKLLDVGYKADNDSTHFNLLFRSNRPTNSKQTEFKYDELISAMKEAAKAKNIYLNTSAENYLIVYSLLHSDDETNVAEMNFFDKNEEKGEMRSWPIYGTTLNSENFTQEQIFNISSDLSWFMDDSLDDLTFDLYSTLNNFDYSSANLLIVFHCTHGFAPLFLSSLYFDHVIYYFRIFILFSIYFLFLSIDIYSFSLWARKINN